MHTSAGHVLHLVDEELLALLLLELGAGEAQPGHEIVVDLRVERAVLLEGLFGLHRASHLFVAHGEAHGLGLLEEEPLDDELVENGAAKLRAALIGERPTRPLEGIGHGPVVVGARHRFAVDGGGHATCTTVLRTRSARHDEKDAYKYDDEPSPRALRTVAHPLDHRHAGSGRAAPNTDRRKSAAVLSRQGKTRYPRVSSRTVPRGAQPTPRVPNVQLHPRPVFHRHGHRPRHREHARLREGARRGLQ
jgi:hypothetical protein